MIRPLLAVICDECGCSTIVTTTDTRTAIDKARANGFTVAPMPSRLDRLAAFLGRPVVDTPDLCPECAKPARKPERRLA